MSYEANPAGINVGKRYGVRNVGGNAGESRSVGPEKEIVFTLRAGEPLAGTPMTNRLPANYRVISIEEVVVEAFAASSTYDLSIGGGAGMTVDGILSATHASAAKVTTGLGNLSSTDPETIVLTANANSIASATGRAVVTVKYVSIAA